MYLNYPQKNRWNRTLLDPSSKSVLEYHFRKHKTPPVEEITFLAESLQLEKKVVCVWFKNRRQKEKREMLLSTRKTTPIISPRKEFRFSETPLTQFKRKINPYEVDLYNLPLNLSARKNYGNVRRFSLGKPNEFTQRRAVLVLGTKELIHKKFIDQIINYIVNVKDEDKFHLQVVEEEGQSNCISVYDIHPAEGFRIPYSLTIVVTPYSGECEDFGQLFRDQKVAEMFREFIEDKDGIKELDMICNVTVKTGHIKQPFLSIFGKDVEKNINNWELTADFLNDNSPWQAVILHFFTVLARMKTVPLSLTQLVLYERKKMKEIVDCLRSLITVGLSKMEEMNNAKQMITYCESQMKLELELAKSVHPRRSGSSTSASGFYFDCPENCNMPHSDNHEVINLACDREIYIKQEPSNIWWQENQSYYTDHQSYSTDEIKWKDTRSKGQQLVKSLQKDLLKNGKCMQQNFTYIWRCVQRFNTIALLGNSFLNPKVFDLLLEAEQHLKQLSF